MLDEIIKHCSAEAFAYAISESAGPSKHVRFLRLNGQPEETAAYLLKADAEDFMVEEVLRPAFCAEREAKYTYLLAEKTDLSTSQAMRLVSNALNVRMREIGRSGIKDKRAVAVQWFSVPGVHGNAKERVANVSEKLEGKLKILQTGFGKEPVSIGMHESNRFRIILRDVSKKPDIKEGTYSFPNYFDTQRVKLTSAILGELFYNLKSRKPGSVETFLKRTAKLPLSMKKADSKFRWACRLLEEWGENGTRTLMEKLTRQDKREYLTSLSCCLWNYKLSKFLKEKEKDAEEMLLRGNALGTIALSENASNQVLESGQIGFAGKMIERSAFAEADVESIEWKRENSSYTCTIEMELPRGCYATLFLKWIFAREVFS